MVGQGSPQRALDRRSNATPHRMCRQSCPFIVLVLCCALQFCALQWVPASLCAEELDVHVRISWGEGSRRLWSGSIQVSQGSVGELRCLGIEADAPNRWEPMDRGVKFFQRTPVSFDGLDVHVVGPPDAMLAVELTPADQRDAVKRVEVRLSDFTTSSAIVHNSQLDDRQNRLQIQRAPGDRLRVQFDRDSLVFSPGEEFVFELLPHSLGLEEDTAIRCSIQLVESRTETVKWKAPNHDFRVDAAGGTAPIGPVKVPIPNEEGVYDVVVSLSQRRLGDAIVPSKPLNLRKVQLIVIDQKARSSPPAEWQFLEEIDSSNPKWWERWMWIPQWTKLRNSAPSGPLGDQPLQKREFGGIEFKELGPAGWHAAPIPIANIGEPHLLEIECPRSARQTLGISILEPNAVDQIGIQALDSGMDLRGEPIGGDTVLEKHRLVFWPRSKTPWLLLTNRRDDEPAVFGSLRVYSGPAELPSYVNEDVNSEGRLAAAYFDKPFFPDNFGAAEALDSVSNRSLRDWNTFYVGVLRLAEYLKYAGYNAAFLPVVCDGGALYPTALLDTTAKYENGRLFVSGQDPVSKDVLEVVLRIFDREGLKLIPTVQFGTPLPELETIMRGESNDMNGIPLVGAFPGDTRAMLGRAESRRGLSPYYNPLDSRVQVAMRRVTTELAQRCAGHASFAGIGIQLGPYSYAQLPDDSWALDDVTFDRFLKETRLAAPAPGADAFAARLAAVRGPMRTQWLGWRSAQITGFYRQIQDDISKTTPSTNLYLHMHDLVAGRNIQNAVRPQLPARADFVDALLRHGIDTNLLSKSNGLVVLRPQLSSPQTSLSAQATNIELEQSANVDQQFQLARPTGTLVYHEPQFLRLPGFDAVSPWGPDNTYTRLAATISPSGPDAKARLAHSIATLDASVFAAGGWMMTMGQEESVRPLLTVLRRLPAEPFETVRPKLVERDTSNVVVRTLRQNGKTWLYVANATGLSAKLELVLQDCPVSAKVDMLSEEQSPMSQTSPNLWTARLAPYDLVAMCMDAPRAKVEDWRVEFSANDVADLERTVQELRARVSGLRDPQPLQVLNNADFEQPDLAAGIAGWTYSRRPGVTVRVDGTSAHRGQSSLYVQVNAPNTQGWVRSDPFPIPKTGRISLLARLRTRDVKQQPPLRMAIDGRGSDGVSFSHRSRPLNAAQPLPEDWSGEFIFHVVNLPAGSTGEMTVRFDLLGAGEVWIDDVQVFDLFFQDVEQNELLKNVANANFQLQKREFAACQKFLQGYWPRFVLEYAPSPRVAQVPRDPARSTKLDGQPKPAQPEPKQSYWDRLKPKPPFKLPLP